MSSKTIVLLTVLAVAAQTFCCGTGLSSPQPPYTVDSSNEPLDPLQEQVESIEADAEGKFTVTITEEEMTALVVQMLEEMEDPPPISQPQVFFRNDRVELYGTIHTTGAADVPGMIALSLDVQGGDVLVTVEEIDVGPLPVPGSLVETATKDLNQALDDWMLDNMANYEITDIRIGAGKAVVYVQALNE
jgi:uncharacterized protein YpmS